MSNTCIRPTTVMLAAGALALLLGAPAARADDAGGDEPDAAGDAGGDAAGAGGDAAGVTADGAAGDASAVAGEEGATPSMSSAVIDRAYATARGKLAAYGGLDVAHAGVGSSGVTAERLGLGGAYGVVDKLDVGLEYAFALHSFEIEGPLTLYGLYDVRENGKLSMAVSGGLVVDLNATTVDPVSGATKTGTTETLAAGLAVRYRVAPKVVVFSGAPYGPGLLASQLRIGFQSGAPITLSVPVGGGYQATPRLFAWADTTLAEIFVSNAPRDMMGNDQTLALLGSDLLGIPLDLGALYALTPQLDVGAFLDFADLGSAGDGYALGVMARWYP